MNTIVTRSQIESLSLHNASDGSRNFDFFNADPLKLKNVLFAYHCLDPEIAFSVGPNYIATMLFKFISDEKTVFWCLVGLMKILDWRKFYICSDSFLCDL